MMNGINVIPQYPLNYLRSLLQIPYTNPLIPTSAQLKQQRKIQN